MYNKHNPVIAFHEKSKSQKLIFSSIYSSWTRIFVNNCFRRNIYISHNCKNKLKKLNFLHKFTKHIFYSFSFTSVVQIILLYLQTWQQQKHYIWDFLISRRNILYNFKINMHENF